MRRAWIDILSRAMIEDYHAQRMQKSMPTDPGSATGPIKGRPGLVLMPSKTDPRIKRWQHVGEDSAEKSAHTNSNIEIPPSQPRTEQSQNASDAPSNPVIREMHKETQGAIEEAKNKVSMQLDDGRTADVPSPKGLRKKLQSLWEKIKTGVKPEVTDIRALGDIPATGLRGWENRENAALLSKLAGDMRRAHISMAKSLLRPVAERLARSKLSERSDKSKLSAFLAWNKKSAASNPTPEEAATTISYWANYGLGAFGIGAATLATGIVGGLGALATWAVANLIIGPPIWKHITRHIGRIAVEKLTGEKVDRNVWELNEGYINGRQYKDRLISQGHTEEEAHAKWQQALESRWVKAMETDSSEEDDVTKVSDGSDEGYEDLVLQSLQESIPHATQDALQELLDQAPSEYLQKYQDAQAIVKQILNEYDPQLLETADEHTMADISARALLPFAKTLENEQGNERINKSLPTEAATGPIKGRPGLVLMPSKSNPKIKRWQKVGEDEGGQQTSGGGAQSGEKEQRSSQPNAQPRQALTPRSHGEEIKDLQQHIRGLTLDPNSKEDQDDKYMAGKQILKDVKEHHDHMLDMIKNKHVSADEAEAYTQSLQDLDKMVGSWEKAGYKSAESGAKNNSEKKPTAPIESSHELAMQHIHSLSDAISKDPLAASLETQKAWKETHDYLHTHAQNLSGKELDQIATHLEELAEKIQTSVEKVRTPNSPQSLLQKLMDIINLALAHLGFRKEKYQHVSNMEIPDRKKVERIAYLSKKKDNPQFKRISEGANGITFIDNHTGALIKYGNISRQETETMRVAELIGVGPKVYAAKPLETGKTYTGTTKELPGAVAMEFLGGYRDSLWVAEQAGHVIDPDHRMESIIGAVRKLHEKGVYHGDLHAGNIFMSFNNNDGAWSIKDTKLIDYGYSQLDPQKALFEVSDSGSEAMGEKGGQRKIRIDGRNGEKHALRLHTYFTEKGLGEEITAIQKKYREEASTPKSREEHQQDIASFYREIDGLMAKRKGKNT